MQNDKNYNTEKKQKSIALFSLLHNYKITHLAIQNKICKSLQNQADVCGIEKSFFNQNFII